MDWDAYFRAAGLAGQSDFIVWQPTAVTGTSALVDSESIDAMEGLSQVSPDRTLFQRFAEGGGCRRFRFLRQRSCQVRNSAGA